MGRKVVDYLVKAGKFDDLDSKTRNGLASLTPDVDAKILSRINGATFEEIDFFAIVNEVVGANAPREITRTEESKAVVQISPKSKASLSDVTAKAGTAIVILKSAANLTKHAWGRIGSLKERLFNREPEEESVIELPKDQVRDAPVGKPVAKPAQIVVEQPTESKPAEQPTPPRKITIADKLKQFGPDPEEEDQLVSAPGSDPAIPVTQTAARRSANPALRKTRPSANSEEPTAAPAKTEEPNPQPVNSDDVEVDQPDQQDQPDNQKGGPDNKPTGISGGIIGGFNSIGDFFLSHIMWFGIGAGILILVILGFVLLPKIHPSAGANPAAQTASPTQTATQAVQKPPATPKLTPIDLAHVSWLSLTQYVIILFTLLVMVGIPTDEWRRSKSLTDTFWVLLAVGLIMGYAFFAKLLIGWIGPGTPHNFKTEDVNWILSFVCVVGAFFIVVVATQQGGFDLTPLAGFLTILGGIILIFGHIGAIQELFNISDNAVLPVSQVGVLLTLKQTDKVSMTVLAYSLLGLGAVIYFIELIRTVLGLDGGISEKIIYAVTCFVGLIAYVALKNWLISVNIPPFVVILLIVAIGVIAAIVHEQFGKSDISVGVGERRFRDALIPPYDKIAFQVTLGLLLIAMTGRVI